MHGIWRLASITPPPPPGHRPATRRASSPSQAAPCSRTGRDLHQTTRSGCPAARARGGFGSEGSAWLGGVSGHDEHKFERRLRETCISQLSALSRTNPLRHRQRRVRRARAEERRRRRGDVLWSTAARRRRPTPRPGIATAQSAASRRLPPAAPPAPPVSVSAPCSPAPTQTNSVSLRRVSWKVNAGAPGNGGGRVVWCTLVLGSSSIVGVSPSLRLSISGIASCVLE